MERWEGHRPDRSGWDMPDHIHFHSVPTAAHCHTPRPNHPPEKYCLGSLRGLLYWGISAHFWYAGQFFPDVFLESTTVSANYRPVAVYYLTIWFQVIDRLTAMESGIRILPLLLGMIAATLFSGVLVRFIGYYMVPMYLGLLFMAVGAGLLTTLNEKTSLPSRIGYQLLYGWGMGCVNQAPNLAAQAVLPLADVPIGTATMFFFQCLGGAIFIPVGQNVMISQLLKRLAGMSAFDPSLLKSSGATTINQFTGADEVIFLHAYNSSLVEVFRVGLVLTCVMGLSALRMECKSTKTAKAEEVHSTEGGRGDHDEIPVMDDIDHNLFEFYRAHTPDVGACVEAMGRKR